MRRRQTTLQPTMSVGDAPASPGLSPATGEASTSTATSARCSLSVRRSRFFLEHKEGSESIHDTYEIEKKPVGEGGFGTVCRAYMRGADSVVRAVKTVRKKSAASETMVNEEVAILRSLDHPYICRLFETFSGHKCVYLVMEFVDGQELFEYISDSAQLLDEAFAARVMRQVFSALHYCHGRKVVHRDLKPENIMVLREPPTSPKVHAPEVKLIDFGLAACYARKTRPASGSVAGTYVYLAPETQRGAPAHPASDLWSCGMVLHALLAGDLPGEGVRRGERPLDLSGEQYAGLSAKAKELLTGLIRIDAAKRFTAADAGASAWLREKVKQASHAQISKTMKAFSAFHKSSMLRRAVLTALAMQLADQQVVDLQTQFLSIDGDKNGTISRDELAMSIVNASGGFKEDVQSWVESVFASIDTDGSEEIEYTEWLAAALHEGSVRSEQAMRAAFRVFDQDGSGKISQHEVARIIMQAPDDIAILFPQFDLNGDGELDFEEFRALTLQWPQRGPNSRTGTRELETEGASATVAAAAAPAPKASKVCTEHSSSPPLDAKLWCAAQLQSLTKSSLWRSRASVKV